MTDAAPQLCRVANCRFCELADGNPDLFAEMYGVAPTIRAAMPESLLLMMDSFPIGCRGGHLLLVPRTHVRSLAGFPSSVDLRNATATAAELLQDSFPNHWLFTFEHGPGVINNRPVRCGGCHVDHAHGHILVLDRSVTFERIRDLTEDALYGLDWEVEDQMLETDQPFVGMSEFTGGHPYLQIGILAGDAPVAVTYKQLAGNRPIPSQLLRKVVSSAAGDSRISAWNWKHALQHRLEDRLQQYRTEALSFLRHLEAGRSVTLSA